MNTGTHLIRTTRSLITAGTEWMLVDFGKANPFSKACQRPGKVRQVLEKVRTDGLAQTRASQRAPSTLLGEPEVPPCSVR